MSKSKSQGFKVYIFMVDYLRSCFILNGTVYRCMKHEGAAIIILAYYCQTTVKKAPNFHKIAFIQQQQQQKTINTLSLFAT